MSNWPHDAHGPEYNDEPNQELAEKLKELTAETEEPKPEFAAGRALEQLVVVAKRLEIARAPERIVNTADPEPETLSLGRIGRAAMVDMVPVSKLMELLDKEGPLTRAGKAKPKKEAESTNNLNV